MDISKTHSPNKYHSELGFPNYKNYQLERLLPSIKTSMLVGVFFLSLYSYFDIRDYPLMQSKIIIVRVAACIPLLIIFALSFIDRFKQIMPTTIVILGIVSMSIYVYLHTFLNEKIYLIALAYFYYIFILVTFSSLYTTKQIAIYFSISMLSSFIILFAFSPDYQEYISTFLLKFIGVYIFAYILMLKVQKTHFESYSFALQLHKKSMFDELTQIYNRHGFNIWIKKKFNEKLKTSILMLDIDDFKKINDKHGHQFGDLVIKNTVQIIKKTCDGFSNCIVRLGGEEFIVVIQGRSAENCFTMAERIRKNIEQYNYLNLSKVDLSICVSIGISWIYKTDKLYDLIGFADANLIKAKETGKNKVVGFP